jgi:hypothetical protein
LAAAAFSVFSAFRAQAAAKIKNGPVVGSAIDRLQAWADEKVF